jgi:hypothetical protein
VAVEGGLMLTEEGVDPAVLVLEGVAVVVNERGVCRFLWCVPELVEDMDAGVDAGVDAADKLVKLVFE